MQSGPPDGTSPQDANADAVAVATDATPDAFTPIDAAEAADVAADVAEEIWHPIVIQ